MRTDARTSGGATATPLVLLSAMVAILFSALLCILLQDVVPPGHGPEYALFRYNGELVAIGLTGGVVPLLASFAMLAASTGVRRDGARPPPFRSLAYWLAVLAVGLLVTLFFTASHALYGGWASRSCGPFGWCPLAARPEWTTGG